MQKSDISNRDNLARRKLYNQLKVRITNGLVHTPYPVVACLLIILICLLLFAPALKGAFLGDDFACVKLYHNPKWLEWPKLFYSEWSQGIWGFQLPELRPFIALAFMVDAVVWHINPFGYHLTNILIHALNSILLFFVVRSLKIGTGAAALVAALLFAAHPSHIEAVYIVSGRTDLLPATFLLGSFLTFIFYRSQNKIIFYIFSIVLYALGLFAKETIIPFPGLLIAYDLLVVKNSDKKIYKTVASSLPYLIALAGYLYLRKSLFGTTVPMPTAWGEFWHRQSIYLNSLFPPLNIQQTWIWALLILFIIACTVFLKYFRRRLTGVYNTLLFFGIAWYLISIMPLVVTYVAPRHLYIASIGTCVMLAIAGQRLLPKRIFLLGTLILLTCYSVFTSQYVNESAQVSSISTSAQQKVDNLVSEAPKGSVLIVDIPASYNRDRLWAWSSPFVFQKPFRAVDAEEYFHILERPDNYYTHSSGWRQLDIVKKLIKTPFDGNIIYLSDDGQVKVKKIEREKLQLMLGEFVAKWEALNQSSLNDLWVDFWRQYYK
jgi:hypothetical protein